MKTHYYIVIMALFLAMSLSAQDQSQAIRFSHLNPQGSARYNAMGGAFGAIGGDFSSASQNPAGLGLFRSSQFTITPSFLINNSKSNYLGESNKDNTTNFSIANLGLVTSINTNREEGLVGATFAFGYNTLNNFNSTTLMQGQQQNSLDASSLLDNFAYYANNNNTLDGFYEDLAFQSALMPFDSAANSFWHYLEPYDAIGYDGYGQEQVRVLERRGSAGEYALSAAVNFSHKIYLGATLGIQSIRYYEDIYHSETDVNGLEPDFDSFSFGEYNTTRGYGYAFKLGVIYKPIHILRIGASFHAPVVYQLTDDKYTDLNTYWDVNSGLDDGYVSSGVFSKDYTLRTPYRASLSTALLIGKLGIVSAEYEYVDYSSSDLNSPGYKFIDENIAISKDFGVAHNVKVGAELRLNPIYLRGGAQYYMNPFSDTRNGSDIFVYSGGIGFRSDQTFVDFAYTFRTSSELYGLYLHSPEFEEGFEKSVNSYRASNLMVTVGFKF
jgi:long-subunit fatty acid transport protein